VSNEEIVKSEGLKIAITKNLTAGDHIDFSVKHGEICVLGTERCREHDDKHVGNHLQAHRGYRMCLGIPKQMTLYPDLLG
jgi:hypothetical protein